MAFSASLWGNSWYNRTKWMDVCTAYPPLINVHVEGEAMTSIDSTTKTCTKCKTEYPATTEFFPPRKRDKSGLDSWCKACHRKSANEYQKAHSAERAAYSKKRRIEHAEVFREREHAYYLAHADAKREKAQRWRLANPDKVRENNRQYRETKPDKMRMYKHRRRALKRNAEGTNTPFDEKVQLKRQKSRCYYCQCKLTEYHVDHVIPLSRGGSDFPDNKVLACPSCNVQKYNRLPHEWTKGGRLL